tara:strand:+ start:2638 stop:3756 length:1119 start_codon:yes stop_codon:yes gene_type:complete
MDLDFNQDQVLLRDSVSAMCAQFSNLLEIRSVEGKEPGYSESFWQQLIDLGITGMNIQEEYGGLGMNLFESLIVYEEFGRNLSFSPHFISCCHGATLVSKLGNNLQKDEILPLIATGDSILSVAWLEKGSSFAKEGINMEVQSKDDYFFITGKKQMVPYASSANKMVLLCKNSNSNLSAFLIDTNLEGISLNYQPNHAGENLHEVSFDRVKLDKSMMLAEGQALIDAWNSTVNDCLILLAAQASGGSEQALHLAVKYSKERELFGQLLGGFQSIAHYLADALVEVEANKLLCYQAAWAKDENMDIERLSAMAKMQTCQTFRDVSATTIQIYGGLGFTSEADPQLFFRRAKHLQNSLWDRRYLEERISNILLD